MEEFKLGPFQTQWLADLRAYPERQIERTLGIKTTDGLRMCCLGQAILTYNEMNSIKCQFTVKSYESELKTLLGNNNDIHEVATLSEVTRNLLGFHSVIGIGITLGGFIIKGESYSALTSANDNGVTWSEIADLVESNPKEFFFKSV